MLSSCVRYIIYVIPLLASPKQCRAVAASTWIFTQNTHAAQLDGDEPARVVVHPDINNNSAWACLKQSTRTNEKNTQTIRWCEGAALEIYESPHQHPKQNKKTNYVHTHKHTRLVQLVCACVCVCCCSNQKTLSANTSLCGVQQHMPTRRFKRKLIGCMSCVVEEDIQHKKSICQSRYAKSSCCCQQTTSEEIKQAKMYPRPLRLFVLCTRTHTHTKEKEKKRRWMIAIMSC